jgi:hypothetical protein
MLGRRRVLVFGILTLSCGSFGAQSDGGVVTSDAGTTEAGTSDAGSDAPAANCTTLFEDRFETKPSLFIPKVETNGAGDLTVTFDGELHARVATNGGSYWRAWGERSFALGPSDTHLQLRHTLRLRGIGTFFAEVGCGYRLRRDNAYQEVRLELFNDKVFVGAASPAETRIEILSRALPDVTYPIDIDFQAKSDWTVATVQAKVADTSRRIDVDLAGALGGVPTSIDLRCGIIFLNNGTTPGFDVNVDDLLFQRCSP